MLTNFYKAYFVTKFKNSRCGCARKAYDGYKLIMYQLIKHFRMEFLSLLVNKLSVISLTHSSRQSFIDGDWIEKHGIIVKTIELLKLFITSLVEILMKLFKLAHPSKVSSGEAFNSITAWMISIIYLSLLSQHLNIPILFLSFFSVEFFPH